MSESLDRLAAVPFFEATLWVLDSNPRARRFYEVGGWTLDGAARPHTIGGQSVQEIRYRRALP